MSARVSKRMNLGPMKSRSDWEVVRAHSLGDLLIDLMEQYPTVDVASLRFAEDPTDFFTIQGEVPE